MHITQLNHTKALKEIKIKWSYSPHIIRCYKNTNSFHIMVNSDVRESSTNCTASSKDVKFKSFLSNDSQTNTDRLYLFKIEY